jgi:hypothetical protein
LSRSWERRLAQAKALREEGGSDVAIIKRAIDVGASGCATQAGIRSTFRAATAKTAAKHVKPAA